MVSGEAGSSVAGTTHHACEALRTKLFLFGAAGKSGEGETKKAAGTSECAAAFDFIFMLSQF